MGSKTKLVSCCYAAKGADASKGAKRRRIQMQFENGRMSRRC